MDHREFDIIIWGASGYTAGLVCLYLTGTYGPPSTGKGGVRYAIAGRNEGKLLDVEQKIKEYLSSTHDVEELADVTVPKVMANLAEPSSLVEMCKRTKVVLAMAGPFGEIGEPIVRACIEARCHYIDITGETPWVAAMRNRYDGEAKEKRVKIVPCCGFDYVPVDLTLHVAQSSRNSQGYGFGSKAVLLTDADMVGSSGGTQRSVIRMMKTTPWKDFLGRDGPWMSCERIPTDVEVRRANADINGIVKLKEAGCWMVPGLMSRGMSRYLHWAHEVQGRPYGESFVMQVGDRKAGFFSALWAWLRVSGTLLLLLLLSLIPGSSALFPAAGQGPRVTSFHMEGRQVVQQCIVSGSETKTQSSEEKNLVTNCTLTFKGGEPYAFTAVSAVEAALVCALEEGKAPELFGIGPPSTLLGSTYVNRLKARGVTFDESHNN